jgi:hypothetical protein
VLLNESYFASESLSSDEGYNDTTYQKLVLSCRIAGRLVPGIEARPSVIVDGI